REEARAQLLLARYGVVTRELAQGDWATLRHSLLRMEYGGEVVRGYFVEGLSGEQYALEECLTDLAASSRRAELHVLVNLADPANIWGRAWPLSRRDGGRRSGRPAGHGARAADAHGAAAHAAPRAPAGGSRLGRPSRSRHRGVRRLRGSRLHRRRVTADLGRLSRAEKNLVVVQRGDADPDGGDTWMLLTTFVTPS